MQNRSNRGSGKPVWVRVHYKPELMIGTRSRRIALGPAAQPHQQAGHMTALDQFAPALKYTLPKRSRPHMTHSGHGNREFGLAEQEAGNRITRAIFTQGLTPNSLRPNSAHGSFGQISRTLRKSAMARSLSPIIW